MDGEAMAVDSETAQSLAALVQMQEGDDDQKEKTQQPSGSTSPCFPLLDLPDDLLSTILGLLSTREALCSAFPSSKRLAACLRKDSFWRCRVLRKNTKIKTKSEGGCSDAKVVLPLELLNIHQLQRICVFNDALVSKNRHQQSVDNSDADGLSEQQQQRLPACLSFGSILVNWDDAHELRRNMGNADLRRACLSSSTEHLSEAIENILLRNETAISNSWDALPRTPPAFNTVIDLLAGRSGRWWSSMPSVSKDTVETLVFTSKYPLACIVEIALRALRDPQDADIVYTWPNTIIKCYRLNNTKNENFVTGHPCTARTLTPSIWNPGTKAPSDQEAIDVLLQNETPVYESPLLDGSVDDQWKRYDLPKDVVANLVCIQLVGKHRRQFDSSGYYTCLSGIVVRGFPLHEESDATPHG